MKPSVFVVVRSRVVQCLRTRNFRFERRGAIDAKKHLSSQQFSPEQVVDYLLACRRHEFSSSPHHWAPEATVYIFRPTCSGVVWYIKVYFADDAAIFISVHPT